MDRGGYSLWGHKEFHMTEWLASIYFKTIILRYVKYEKSEKYWYHFYLPFSHSHIYFTLCFKHKYKNSF